MMKSTPAGQSAAQALRAFVAAVDWTEPFLRYLLALHVVVFLVALLTRHRYRLQGVLLALLGRRRAGGGAVNPKRCLSRQLWRSAPPPSSTEPCRTTGEATRRRTTSILRERLSPYSFLPLCSFVLPSLRSATFFELMV
jgi:hypothetical protein